LSYIKIQEVASGDGSSTRKDIKQAGRRTGLRATKL